MALTFARKLDGGTASIISDIRAAIAGDTVATQTNGTAGAYTPVKGDLLSFNDQGRAVIAKHGASTVAGDTNTYILATNALGVCEGPNFQGLAQGGVYAATTASQNSQSYTIAKVHTGLDDVYAIPVVSGTPTLGTAYTIQLVGTYLDAQLNTGNPAGTTQIAKVVQYDAPSATAYVVLTAVQE